MRCPDCQHEDTSVLETRLAKDGAAIRRRRQCLSCKNRFNTLEQLDSKDLLVKKRDGSKESFDKEKIRKGVELALSKRPVVDGVIDGMIEQVVTEILDKGVRVIESKEIGRLVLGYLKKFDEVAYLRFASVCNYFEDITHFREELDNLTGDEA